MWAGDIDPVIYVPMYDGRDALLPSVCCHIMCRDIWIVCPISGDGEFSDQSVGIFMYRMKANQMTAAQGTVICVRIFTELCGDITGVF
jgi:hypothetical protein